MRRNRTGCPIAVRSPTAVGGEAHRIAVLVTGHQAACLPHEHPVCLAVLECAGISGLRSHYCAPLIGDGIETKHPSEVQPVVQGSGDMSVPIFRRP